MLSMKGDQREFLAGESESAVCGRDPWTKGQFTEMTQELENKTIMANYD